MGINPIKIINNAGNAASYILSSEANKYTFTAKVSKLKGLNIKVAGNSFTTSDITNKKLVSKPVLSKGT
jgi:hypothetical protein